MPSHSHSISPAPWRQLTGYGNINVGSTTGSNAANISNAVTGSSGGGQAHNNLQPYAVTQYIIKS